MALFQSGNPVNNQPATAFIINGGEKEKEEEEEEEKRERESSTKWDFTQEKKSELKNRN